MERETTNQAPNLTSHAQEKIKKKKEKKRKEKPSNYTTPRK
jgi:hypothetical protein